MIILVFSFFSFLLVYLPLSFKMSTQKRKGKSSEKHVSSTVPKIDELPLIDLDVKIVEIRCEFDLHELQNWAFHKFEDNSDESSLWESMLPQFVFP